MKSSEKVLTQFGLYLLDKGVNTLITGNIYKSRFIPTDQLENIEIGVLFSRNEYVQTGIINLNLYIPSDVMGRPNTKRFEEIADVLSADLSQGIHGNYRFQIETQSGVMQDETQDKMYFKNIRFNFQTI